METVSDIYNIISTKFYTEKTFSKSISLPIQGFLVARVRSLLILPKQNEEEAEG